MKLCDIKLCDNDITKYDLDSINLMLIGQRHELVEKLLNDDTAPDNRVLVRVKELQHIQELINKLAHFEFQIREDV